MATSKFQSPAITTGTPTSIDGVIAGDNGSVINGGKRNVTLTKAQYNNLSAADKAKDILYVITDDDSASNYQPIITANGVLQGDGNGNITARAVDVTPTASSTNLITSGGVESAIKSVVYSTDRVPKSLGSVTSGTSYEVVTIADLLPSGAVFVGAMKITALGANYSDTKGILVPNSTVTKLFYIPAVTDTSMTLTYVVFYKE